jgi:hypothetical protein
MKSSQEWYKNFVQSISEIIEEAIKNKRRIQGIAISQDLMDKMSEALGHRPNNILGYKLEVQDFEEEQALKDLIAEHGLEGEYEVEGYFDIIDQPLN